MCVCMSWKVISRKPKPALRPSPTGRRHAGHAREHIPVTRSAIDRKLFSIFFYRIRFNSIPPIICPSPSQASAMQVNLTWGVRVMGEGASGKVCFFDIQPIAYRRFLGTGDGISIGRLSFLRRRNYMALSLSHLTNKWYVEVVGSKKVCFWYMSARLFNSKVSSRLGDACLVFFTRRGGEE